MSQKEVNQLHLNKIQKRVLLLYQMVTIKHIRRACHSIRMSAPDEGQIRTFIQRSLKPVLIQRVKNISTTTAFQALTTFQEFGNQHLKKLIKEILNRPLKMKPLKHVKSAKSTNRSTMRFSLKIKT